MKKHILAVALLCLPALAGSARAVICTVDQVPAATLLLPYFEVDLDNPSGVTTLFSVNNASATAVLTHVVVYSDLSVPVLDFNLYLTGYDVQTVNLRDILINGKLPQTATAGQDTNDTISKKGAKSQDINFASCDGQLPPPPLPQNFIDHLQLSLTGQSSPLLGDQCAGQRFGDNIARGYITIDTVNNCTLRLPGDPAYFANDITFQNVLWGDFFYLNGDQNFADGDTLVHIEASLTDPATTTPDTYTFYGRYVGWNAADHREPLGTTFVGRFVTGGDFTGGTSYIVWRDSKSSQDAFPCIGTIHLSLSQEGIDIFDESEQVNVPQSFPFSPQPPEDDDLAPFPAEAQRTLINSDDFPVPFDFGWLYLDLNTTFQLNQNPLSDPAAAQAWVGIVMDANGRFSVGFPAIQLDSACAANHFFPSAD